MTDNVSTGEHRQNLAPWKRLVVISASFGVAFALALSVNVGVILWYSLEILRCEPPDQVMLNLSMRQVTRLIPDPRL
jgi:hypothetical protein